MRSSTNPLHRAIARGGEAPALTRAYVRADANKWRRGRKGAKARAKMRRFLLKRYDLR